MGYTEVVEALYERHRSVRDAGFSGDAYKPGLESMAAYAEFLGHPERGFRSIHVAGTNGKGTVCSMLAAALSARGLRVGLYTSPHLLDFRERIKIVTLPSFSEIPEERSDDRGVLRGTSPYPLGVQGDSCLPSFSEIPEERSDDRGVLRGTSPYPLGVQGDSCLPSFSEISEKAVCEFMERYDREGLTFFEVTTGMAFWWFAEQKVDVAVIETGLGGRLDSTNIIVPELSVITSIGLDHCDLLGSTRAEIAAEKAGIFKPGVPALVWGRDDETQPVFERVAAEAGAPLYYAEDYPPAIKSEAKNLPDPGAPGPCAAIDARITLAALHILNLQPSSAGYRAIADAARITGLRGRSEVLLRNPLTICDIGHNPPALKQMMTYLRSLCGNNPLIIIYGIMRDKAIDDILPILPADAEYYLVQPQTPRAMPLQALALKLKKLNTVASGTVAQGVQSALERARELPGAVIYIGGSTFVVSEAITYIESL